MAKTVANKLREAGYEVKDAGEPEAYYVTLVELDDHGLRTVRKSPHPLVDILKRCGYDWDMRANGNYLYICKKDSVRW